ncbi:VOC family protein [Mesorhizobium sp. RP14(2022)]|uniref:VOC family protein n=1 Tax=Mesorhizobium liriopis TaxID=2953882 RepID=A0ABT1C601_9HYPH|nr:VOC family protein [Mesorhizobium liriopis]MCO6049928.1 VOC family protein [Mesorhizobium liriopis]
MAKLIFVNLPVSDLSRSIAFYKGIGATQDMRFSDDTAACMVFSDTIHVMLLTHEKFSSFTPRGIADAHETAQVLLCISADDREGVDAMVSDAAKSGGVADHSPQQDYGFMYGRSFEDPDGHVWEVMWMDLDAAMKAFGEQSAA